MISQPRPCPLLPDGSLFFAHLESEPGRPNPRKWQAFFLRTIHVARTMSLRWCAKSSWNSLAIHTNKVRAFLSIPLNKTLACSNLLKAKQHKKYDHAAADWLHEQDTMGQYTVSLRLSVYSARRIAKSTQDESSSRVRG